MTVEGSLLIASKEKDLDVKVVKDALVLVKATAGVTFELVSLTKEERAEVVFKKELVPVYVGGIVEMQDEEKFQAVLKTYFTSKAGKL